MSGGYRAAAKDKDEQLLQLNRAAMKACIAISAKQRSARQGADSRFLCRTCVMQILLLQMSLQEPGLLAKRCVSISCVSARPLRAYLLTLV